MSRIIILTGRGRNSNALIDLYRARGDEVHPVSSEADLATMTGMVGAQPVDLLICANDDQPQAFPVAKVERESLIASLHVFTFLPLRLAALLRANLALAGGRAVLLTTPAATMDFVDEAGRYLERPFRAAAHALWRCLAIEWQPDGIGCALIALDGADSVERLAELIPSAPSGVLIDSNGRLMGW